MFKAAIFTPKTGMLPGSFGRPVLSVFTVVMLLMARTGCFMTGLMFLMVGRWHADDERAVLMVFYRLRARYKELITKGVFP
jgi:hypothetical protein